MTERVNKRRNENVILMGQKDEAWFETNAYVNTIQQTNAHLSWFSFHRCKNYVLKISQRVHYYYGTFLTNWNKINFTIIFTSWF